MKKIGRYEVEAEIGRGAMGVVYRARDPELRRTVAVKTYTLPPGSDELRRQEFSRRFEREARAAAALSDPGIVTVYDAGEDPDSHLPFIAMEYVPGRSLAQVLEQDGVLPLDRVTAMAEALAGALSTAHAARIVHRDIKPANILIRERDGSAKIADFGVARVESSTLTRSGASLGSPAYMSPEQIRGHEIDGRSDLFSLAVILYELLCGSRPFGGDDLAEVAYSVVHETPIPISRRNFECNTSLDRFFDRALAKQPGDRFVDGAEFWREFASAVTGKAAAEQVAATLRDSASPAGMGAGFDAGDETVPRRRRTRWVAVVGFVVLLGGWIIFGGEEAYLKLDAKSSIDGELAVRVDGRKVYERELNAPQQLERKTTGLLTKIKRTVAGPAPESFEAFIEVEAGKHEIEVLVSPDDGEPYRNTVVVDLEAGQTRRLKLVAGHKLGSTLSLRVE